MQEETKQKQTKEITATEQLVINGLVFIAFGAISTAAWNFVIVPILTPVWVLPTFNVGQVLAIKWLMNYINPFK